MSSQEETVLVTGGTGFLGSFCILQALQKGYNVRTTIRSLARSQDVRQSLREGGVTEAQANSLQIFVADLTKDDGWEAACAGCDYVLHVASPFPGAPPKHEDELVVPAREGALRMLRAAKAAATVKRVVLTSSVAAVINGQDERPQGQAFTETDWTIVENLPVPACAYQKSKTVAERAAWAFVEQEGAGMELATVCPGAIFGPVLGKDVATSLELPIRMLNGKMPGLPQIGFGCADVRDVADLHLRAMENPKAAGQRYIAVSDESFLWMKDLAQYLKTGLPETDAKKVPTRGLPNFLIRLFAYIDSGLGMIVAELGKEKHVSNVKAKEQLGWQPRSTKEAIIASAESLKKYGLVNA